MSGRIASPRQGLEACSDHPSLRRIKCDNATAREGSLHGPTADNSQVANNGVQVLSDHADLGSATFNAVSERRTAPE
jgi:hypothetical protein